MSSLKQFSMIMLLDSTCKIVLDDGGGGGGGGGVGVLVPLSPRGRGVLPYIGYTGMCRSTGYAFCFSDSGTGYKNHRK